ncbi:esterase-like activity of phytase family protein [Aquabacter cavernae]|uniref:esterase-like activity of phytase family protein n=1 Tax=Aquabacter cavernae TaxID=2496029 RepID=UPI000F8D87C2|nr:esterase-like activity of phytase family protein [Aquabacter cavernae]
MRHLPSLLAIILASTAFSPVSALAQQAAPAASEGAAYPATVEGHVALPAATFVPPPADAPVDLQVSGKYAGPERARNDKVGSVPATSVLSDKEAPRPTGLSRPFQGQPVQGFSGIVDEGGGRFLILTDNGYGSKANSSDAMLMFHRVAMDFKAGTITRTDTFFLRDPDKKVPFPIATESTTTRYLTGADFDPESIQVAGDSVWFGEEFGPYLIEADATGKVKAIYETKVDGKTVRSPDHPSVTTPGAPGGKVAFEVFRSKGFEGMAISPDKTKLYAMLEGPIATADGAKETEGGKEVLRVLEFDIPSRQWTGRSWKYPLAVAGNAIGDFNMIDATTALVIERDSLEGTKAAACAEGKVDPTCFHKPAAFKRVYKVEFTPEMAGGLMRKVGHIDLLAMKDPNGKSRPGTAANGTLGFPFFTIEDVVMVDPTHIVVGNDNNLPFSAGRAPQKADDNEFVLLEVGELLKAK